MTLSKLLFTFLFVLLGIGASTAQTSKRFPLEPTLTKLVEIDFLTPHGKDWAKEISKRFFFADSCSSTEILTLLHFTADYEFMFRAQHAPEVEKRVKREDKQLKWQHMSMGGRNLQLTESVISHNRSVWGKTRTRTLQELYEIGLVTEHCYEQAAQSLQAKEIRTEVELLAQLANCEAYLLGYDSQKDRQIKWLHELAEAGLITAQQRDSIAATYGELELKDEQEISALWKQCALVELTAKPTDYQANYRQLYEQLAAFIPEMDLSSLNVTLQETVDGGDMIRQDALIEISIAGTRYAHLAFHDFANTVASKKRKQETNSRYSEEWFFPVNKYLVDTGKAQRIFTQRVRTDQLIPDDRSVQVCYMNKPQATAAKLTWKHGPDEFSSRYSTQFLTTVRQQLDSLGFLKNLSTDQQQELTDCLAQSRLTYDVDILACVPNLLATFWLETGNLENPYEEILLEYAKASNHVFDPQNISDSFGKSMEENRPVDLSFEWNGKRHHKQLQMTGDWLDAEFFSFVHGIIEAEGVNANFRWVGESRLGYAEIFATDAQFEALVKLLPGIKED